MLRILAAAALCVAFSTGASAQSIAPIDTLFRALGMPEIIEIMQEEGIAYGLEMEADLFVGRGGRLWEKQVNDIYDGDQMQKIVRDRMDTELASYDLAPMIDFFLSDRGQRIVQLEVSARRALLDASVEEASIEVLNDMIVGSDPRLELLRDFAVASDLIENNVVGAMNSNYAFYSGLADGGAFPDELSENQILADVWSQEDAIRTDTEEWLFSYLAMAYRPLSDEDLETYTAYFHTVDGTALNSAIFMAFDEMFVGVSRALGLAASRHMVGEEL